MQCKVSISNEYDFYLLYREKANSLSTSLSEQDDCIASHYSSIADIYYWRKDFQMIFDIMINECKRSKFSVGKSEVLEKLKELCIKQGCINLDQFLKIKVPFIKIIECNRRIFELKEEIKYLDKGVSVTIEDAVYFIKNSQTDISRARLERERIDDFLVFHKKNKLKIFKLTNSAIKKYFEKDVDLVDGLNFIDASTTAENNINILKSLVNEINILL